MAGPLTRPILEQLPNPDAEYDPDWDEIGERPTYYDREGYPITIREWMMLHDYTPYREIESTIVGAERVSTVWLGLDHRSGTGPPLIFETMVLEQTQTPRSKLFPDYKHARYCTEHQAQQGHRQIVEELRNASPPDDPGLSPTDAESP